MYKKVAPDLELNTSDDSKNLSFASGSLFYRVMGCKEHRFKAPAEEVIAAWKTEVDAIKNEMSPDSDAHAALRHHLDVAKLSERDLTLAAIGKFFLAKKSRWQGDLMALYHIVFEKEHDLDEFGSDLPNRIDTCVEAPVIMQLLAKEYGIDMLIRGPIANGPLSALSLRQNSVLGAHYYLQEEGEPRKSMRILDPMWWAHGSFGLIRDEEAYKQLILQQLRPDRMIIGAINSSRRSLRSLVQAVLTKFRG